MPPLTAQRPDVANRLLSFLPPEEYERILPDLKEVPLKFRVSLHEPGDKMPYVYFPDTGVISMLTVQEDGDAFEIATIGDEGMTDISVFLGLEESDSRLLVQVPGTARRMESVRFREHVDQIPSLRVLLGYYTVSMLALVAQSAACNRMVEHCARLLRMTNDRVDAAEFPMAHDFLSEMLGVRRPSFIRSRRSAPGGGPDHLPPRQGHGAGPPRPRGCELRMLPPHPGALRPAARP